MTAPVTQPGEGIYGAANSQDVIGAPFGWVDRIKRAAACVVLFTSVSVMAPAFAENAPETLNTPITQPNGNANQPQAAKHPTLQAVASGVIDLLVKPTNPDQAPPAGQKQVPAILNTQTNMYDQLQSPPTTTKPQTKQELPTIKESPKAAVTVSEQGVNLVISYESWSPVMYNDAAGHATIGFGHLIHTGSINGSEPAEFKKGLTEEQGHQLLQKDLESAINAVRQFITVPLNQNQFDALVSFTFNAGNGALQESTLRKELNAGNYDAVPAQLMRWVMADGKVYAGLERRRKEESDVWKTPIGTQPVVQPEASAQSPQSRLAALIDKLVVPIKAMDLKQLKKAPSADVYALLQPAAANQTPNNANALPRPEAAPDLEHPYINKATWRQETNKVRTVEVRGIRIRVEAAINLALLLEAAEKDGFHLTSSPMGAFRSSEDQASLRRENGCPDLTSPSDTCEIATAPVNKSNHESDPGDPKSFAVDFRNNDRPIVSWDDPACVWLDKNGLKYGFKPMDRSDPKAEPWHKSGNGR
ncbi:MAG TPA: glycoside hydrolase family protein [Candidatus Limnocylindrales bacterium]|nr:glycoside hydrolase family protein [Candidatus Limnocylindrales bacterium]